ncbi:MULTISPECIES: response regulator [Ramlibacter]|uniref:Response regulator n=1 Tax=Ramlibacter aquaticus TaxID=2780094 RepID=A0ABR9SHE3_9BURK|nr:MULTISPECIES: response regulator [Ramlibacter]MBE7941775.1 response regulator [Ramlibacter aquaticus]
MNADILIVDDDSDHLELCALALEGACDRVATASSGAQALAQLRACEPQDLPRLLILDVKMGYESGLDLLRDLRADAGLSHLPVVMYSCSSDERDVASSYLLGANAYLVKRSDLGDMRQVLGAAYRTWALPAPAATGTAPVHPAAAG